MSAAEFTYGPPPPAIGAIRQYEDVVECSNAANISNALSGVSGIFAPGQVMKFNIPCGQRNTYLDPSKTWLELTVVNVSDACVQLDGSAHSFVNRVQLFDRAGGLCVEDVEQAGALNHILLNATADPQDLAGRRSGEGFLPPRVSIDFGSTAAPILWTQPALLQGSYQGNVMETSSVVQTPTSNDNVAPAYANGQVQTFSLPLLTTVGALGDKYVPVNKLTRGLRLDLLLAPAREVFKRPFNGLASATANVIDQNTQDYGDTPVLLPWPNCRNTVDDRDYLVTSVRLHVGYIQVDDATQAAIEASTGGEYTWAAQTWRFYRNTADFSGESTQTFNIPASLTSARCAISVWRSPFDVSDTAGGVPRYTSAFPRLYTTEAQYQLGTKYVPQRPIRSLAGFVRYFLDCFPGGYMRPGNVPTNMITAAQNESTDGVAAFADNGGAFHIAADLGGACGNDANTFMAGANTLGESLILTTKHLFSPAGAAFLYYLDTYIKHDVLFRIDANGNFTVTN